MPITFYVLVILVYDDFKMKSKLRGDVYNRRSGSR